MGFFDEETLPLPQRGSVVTKSQHAALTGLLSIVATLAGIALSWFVANLGNHTLNLPIQFVCCTPLLVGVLGAVANYVKNTLLPDSGGVSWHVVIAGLITLGSAVGGIALDWAITGLSNHTLNLPTQYAVYVPLVIALLGSFGSYVRHQTVPDGTGVPVPSVQTNVTPYPSRSLLRQPLQPSGAGMLVRAGHEPAPRPPQHPASGATVPAESQTHPAPSPILQATVQALDAEEFETDSVFDVPETAADTLRKDTRRTQETWAKQPRTRRP